MRGRLHSLVDTPVGGPVQVGTSTCSISNSGLNYYYLSYDNGETMIEAGMVGNIPSFSKVFPSDGQKITQPNKTVPQPTVVGNIGIIGPIGWETPINGFASYWENGLGCEVTKHFIPSDWPYYQNHDTASAQAELKAVIANWYSGSGVRYVFLVGDTALTPQTNYPVNDIIPAFIETVELNENVVRTYYATDLPYSDVDGDGLPDITISRLPAQSSWELEAYFNKMVAYNMGDVNGAEYVVNSIVVDVAGPDYVAAAEYMTYVADKLEVGSLNGADVWRLNESEVNSSIEEEFCDLWSTTWPELVMINSYKSHQNNLGRVLSNREWAYIEPGHNALVFAPTCYGGVYAREDNIRTVVETGLLEKPSGPIAWVGPEGPSWAVANNQFSELFLTKIMENPFRPMAESFRLAVREIIVDHPGSVKFLTTIRRYNFLGDPISPFRNRTSSPVSAVGNEGIQASSIDFDVVPNPFNPKIEIKFDNVFRNIRIDVFDIRGRRIKELFSGRPDVGINSVIWDGKDSSGRAASAGVYFVAIKGPGSQAVRKITLVR